MARQLSFHLRPSPGDRANDCGLAINWLAVQRRARRIAGIIALQSSERSRTGGLRNGFAIRTYAGDAALLERLRTLRAGKQLQRPPRAPGDRLHIPPSVLMAVTTQGRRLHAMSIKLEERVAAREAAALCG